MTSLKTKLTYLALMSLIALCVYGIVREAGHTALCQREIDKVLQEFEGMIQRDPTKITLKPVISHNSEVHWLLAVPAKKSIKLNLVRQGADQSERTQVRSLSLPVSDSAELIAIKVFMDSSAFGVSDQIQFQSSNSASLAYQWPVDETIQANFYTHAFYEDKPTLNLFAIDTQLRAHARMWSIQAQRAQDGEILLLTIQGTSANGVELLYGVTLSTEP